LKKLGLTFGGGRANKTITPRAMKMVNINDTLVDVVVYGS